MIHKALLCFSLITVALSLSPSALAQTFSVIHNFTGGADGSNPWAGVSIKGGNLYGTTATGNNGNGTVYEMVRVGPDWVNMPLYLFSGGSDGAYPEARVTFGPDGHLYGTTVVGGSGSNGTVFQLTPPPTICKTAKCPWTENVLHRFTGHPSDGRLPGYGDLVWDQQGNVYGVAVNGGMANDGAVYELINSEDNWTESLIYSFSGPDGETPSSGLVLNNNGELFGTTYSGGLYGFGTVYKLAYAPGTGWGETVLYNFQHASDGGLLFAGVVFDSSGNLYGATSDGGSGGGGTVFELSPSGDTWTFKLLYSFSVREGYYDCGPVATLAIDASGSLYGTTYCDGANGNGNVFELTKTDNGWEYTSLHDFTGDRDGSEPAGNATLDTDGALYGTAFLGGSQRLGVIWMIKP